jgi:hypothetical protein
MASLYEILAALDAAKRTTKRNLSDLYNDPRGYADKMVGHMKNQNAGLESVVSGGELSNRPMTMSERVDRAINSTDFTGGAGTFIGKGSPLFKQGAAKAAREAFDKGMTPAEVWKAHPGNWVLPDGTIAQEIDDSTAKIIAPWLPDKAKLIAERDRATAAFEAQQARYKAGEIDYPAYEPFVRARLKAENDVVNPPRNDPGNMPLSQFYQHPTLYQAHPELAQMDVRFNPHTNTSFHNPEGGIIEIGTKGANTPADLLGVTAHEAQHPIQDMSGWAGGGSPALFQRMMSNKQMLLNRTGALNPEEAAAALSELERSKGVPGFTAKNDLDAYNRLFGEQMAYATQRRANMGMDERYANFPGEGFTVPVEESIWRREGRMSFPPFVGNSGGYGSYR